MIDRFVGRRIQIRRVICGYSRKDLARKLGLSYQQLQKYESGHNRIGGRSLWQISQELEVTPGYFLQGIESEAFYAPSSVRFVALLAREFSQIKSHDTYHLVGHIARLLVDAVCSCESKNQPRK
ncbi:MAG: helix-turn-helix transcriptional regulator [Alphaproteobacteria bacterium]